MTIFYSHYGLPNTPPTIYDALPSGLEERPDVEVSFKVGDDRGYVEQDGLNLTIVHDPLGSPTSYDVLVAGVWQTGFSGTITPNAYDGFDVVVVPDNPLADGTWEATAYVVDADGASDTEIWSFGVVTKPWLIAVRPILRRVVELEFEIAPVRVRSLEVENAAPVDRFVPVDWTGKGGAASDAANPENYSASQPSQGSLVEPGEAMPLVPVWITEAPGYWYDSGGIRYAWRIEVAFNDQQTARADYLINVDNLVFTGPDMQATSLPFVGYQPSKVVRGSLKLWNEVGTTHRQDDIGTGELAALFGAMQEVLDRMIEDVDAFTVDTMDIETMRRDYLPILLWDLGNPFAFDLTPYEQRKLAGVLVDMYRQKGTCVGIVNAVRFFVGVELVGCSKAWQDTWRLHGGSYPSTVVPQGGPYKLDLNARLGPGTRTEIETFWLLHPTPGSITADQLAQIGAIADYMKPAASNYAGVRAP
jgi:phage tail-like protein